MTTLPRPLRTAFTAVAAAALIGLAGAGAAHAGVYTQLHFPPGTSSTGVGGAIVRGEVDTYIIEARAGQLFSAAVGSVEDNATCSLIAPDGTFLVLDALYDEVVLPEDGNYVLDIAPTRGNTEYWLQVSIV